MCRNAVYYILCTLGSAYVFFVAIVSKTRRSVFTARYEINLKYNWSYFFSLKARHAQAVSRLPLTAETRFDSKSLHVIFVVDKASIEQVFLRMLRFSPLSIFHHCSILVFTDMLFLPEGQVSEDWEPSKKHFCFGNPGIMDRKIFLFFFSSKGHHIFADP